MKLLFLDIETAPNLATVWGLYDQNIAINQLIKPGYTLCWAAKWQGEPEVMFDSIMSRKTTKAAMRGMLVKIHALLNDADAVCHYNGTKFDIPTLNKEFLLLGLRPPPPIRQIDLLKTCRRQFRLASNKLDFVAQTLGLGEKEQHKGHKLWLECMDRKPEAWEVMERYNKQDVILLEKVYDRLLPWIKGHPNRSENSECCPKCESVDFQARGYAVSAAGQYPRYQCQSCGTWFRGKRMVANHTFRETA